MDITNYNVLIDGRNFHDQQINDKIKKYDEIRKDKEIIIQQLVCIQHIISISKNIINLLQLTK